MTQNMFNDHKISIIELRRMSLERFSERNPLDVMMVLYQDLIEVMLE